MLLNDLEYFVAVAENSSFTKAAEKLYVSQPSLTVSVHRLEEELGKTLLVRRRGAKEIWLTEEGEIVFEYAKKIAHDIEIIYDEVKNTARKRIRLGVPPIIGTYLFPKLVKRLKPAYINSLELIETGSENMKRLLLDDEVDMCFIGTELPLDDDKIEKYFIMRDTYSIFVSPEHPLAQRSVIDFSDLHGEHFISLGENFVQHKILKSLCLKENMKQEVDNFLIVNEYQTAKSLISSGVGIGFMITSSIGSRKDICMIPLSRPVYFYIYLAFKKDREITRIENEIKENLIRANSGF